MAVIMTARSEAPGKTQHRARVTAGACKNGGDVEVTPWDTGSLCDSDLSLH